MISLKIQETTDAQGVEHIEIFGRDQDPKFTWEDWITAILDDPNLSNGAKGFALALLTKVAESSGVVIPENDVIQRLMVETA
jgi:hypothetical protein